ncbi:MAG: gamma-glutamyl-gamma-aminobutyrate hydrolase family protein [Gemmatimonadota bacterium]
MTERLKIAISACFFHADPARPIFTGKTLQYVEQSIAHWVQSGGALAVMIPSPEGDTKRTDVTLADYAQWLDGLVLEGGSDMWPGSYGELPLAERWQGDRIRDEYEIALSKAFVAAGKPVLGVCRGLQLLNVAFGGTLYQDIDTQLPGALAHRKPQLYDRNLHSIEFVPGTRLARLYEGQSGATVNSVHHQGIKDLARDFVVEARCPDDGIIEAFRWTGPSYVAGVQWHPEFHWQREHVLNDDAILQDFLAACRATKGRQP